jgi:hypothetical protein
VSVLVFAFSISFLEFLFVYFISVFGVAINGVCQRQEVFSLRLADTVFGGGEILKKCNDCVKKQEILGIEFNTSSLNLIVRAFQKKREREGWGGG